MEINLRLWRKKEGRMKELSILKRVKVNDLRNEWVRKHKFEELKKREKDRMDEQWQNEKSNEEG